MKYTICRIRDGEDELILNYKERTPEVEKILLFLEKNQRKLIGRCDGETIVFSPDEVLYLEKVDEKTFAYTKEQVISLDISLGAAEIVLDDVRFFRCSKSMIINISKVERLKSLPSNRIDVTIEGGEHLIISRTYAAEFRRLLKGE